MNKDLLCHLFLGLLVTLFVMPAWAQHPTSTYLPHTLIIKYEDAHTLNKLRARQGTDPRKNIQQYLTSFGAGSPEPLWDERSLSGFGQVKSRAALDRKKLRRAANDLQRIHSVHFMADVDAAWLAAKVSKLPGVEYAEPRYLRQTLYDPQDRISNPYEQFHNFIEGWDYNRGSSDIVIGIVDSGVDYNHTDLDEKLWRNEDEIADNGIDDDNNGKIDDVIGWDFWASGYTDETITEDNDPMLDANSHGTHVTGIAAAETDNNFGISGTGFNSIYMAIKAGGVPDDHSTSINESQLIGFGIEGIVYAAENGADIINCSWGGGSFSEAENEVIAYATSLGAVVVGASGNTGSTEVIYPAAYKNVIAVGAVGTDNRVESCSNIGYKLDVLATGTRIESTIRDNQFGISSGTSMSTPVVAGLAALLRAQYPGWSANRIATHIRTTSIPLVGSPQVNRLGRGKVDAEAALNPANANLPGIELLNAAFLNEDGEKLGFEEPGNIQVTLVNYGAATSSLTLDIRSTVGGIQFSNPTIQQGTIPNGDTVQVAIPIRITDAFDLSQIPTFRLQFTDVPTGYSDFSMLTYDELLYDVMAANRVKMSVSADGTIGFTHPLEQRGGVGFIPREKQDEEYTEGENLLFEGGLMLQMSGTMYDAVRSTEGELSRNFNPQTTVRLTESGSQADLQGTTHFTTDTVNNISAHIDVNSFSFEDPALSNVVFLLYEIQNPSPFLELNDVHAGLFNDWDIGISDNNGASFSQQDSILYLYDESSENTQPFVAVASLGPLSSALAIDNAAEGRGVNFGIYDGYTDEEKKLSLTAGTEQTEVSGTDVSAVVASGPYTVGPRARVRIGFVYAFGENLNTLQTQIAEARSRAPFMVSNKGLVISEEEPEQTEFFQNYPNPYNGSTRLRLDLSSQSHVNISVYNILGRKVAEIVDKELEPRIHIFNFNSRHLSSGIYFARLQSETRTKTIKMVLVK
ncbi:MAG: S8 family serine peptidase [Balneolaceae bacterium]|nr:S8 family serine peptidase [Balneolaceae bacterium]